MTEGPGSPSPSPTPAPRTGHLHGDGDGDRRGCEPRRAGPWGPGDTGSGADGPKLWATSRVQGPQGNGQAQSEAALPADPQEGDFKGV